VEPEEEGEDRLPAPDRGMTLLHLTAALGFTRLIFTLLEWQHENPSRILQEEINPHRLDDFGLTPLVSQFPFKGNAFIRMSIHVSLDTFWALILIGLFLLPRCGVLVMVIWNVELSLLR